MDIELVPVTFLLSIVAIAKIIADSRIRSKLIEKGVSAEEARALLPSRGYSTHDSSLKWGLVTAGVGIALVIVHLASFHSSDPLVLGIILLFAGAALLTHYLLSALSSKQWTERGAAP